MPLCKVCVNARMQNMCEYVLFRACVCESVSLTVHCLALHLCVFCVHIVLVIFPLPYLCQNLDHKGLAKHLKLLLLIYHDHIVPKRAK